MRVLIIGLSTEASRNSLWLKYRKFGIWSCTNIRSFSAQRAKHLGLGEAPEVRTAYRQLDCLNTRHNFFEAVQVGVQEVQVGVGDRVRVRKSVRAVVYFNSLIRAFGMGGRYQY